VSDDQPTRRRLFVTMGVVAVAVALWCAPGAWARASYGARVTADEPQYLMTAISIGEDGNLDVSDERADGRAGDFHEAALPVQEAGRPDGALVSPHDPLLPAVLAVPMLVGGWLAAKLTLAALAGGLAAAMLWVAVRRLGVGITPAVITVLAFGLAAPLAVYATQVYPELPAALCVTIAIGALLGPSTRASTAVLLGALVALPWLSVKYVPVVAALAVLAAVRMARAGELRRLLGAAGVVAIAGVAYLVLHHLWYGGWTVYASGDHFVGGEATVMGSSPDYAGRSARLLGLLVDRNFGLAAWQPAFLLAVPALAALIRRRPRGWDALVVALAVGWLNATYVALTMHGWWWPGRQTVVVLPCAVLAIAWWAQAYPPARVLVAVGGLIGALVAGWLVVDVLAGHITLVVDFARTTNPVYRAWRTALPDGVLLPAGTAVLRVTWIAVTGALAAWGVWTVRAGPRPSSRPGRARALSQVPGSSPTPRPRSLSRA
jgi:hypothetical protein